MFLMPLYILNSPSMALLFTGSVHSLSVGLPKYADEDGFSSEGIPLRHHESFRSPWYSISYNQLSNITYNGSSQVCSVNTRMREPPSSSWMVPEWWHFWSTSIVEELNKPHLFLYSLWVLASAPLNFSSWFDVVKQWWGEFIQTILWISLKTKESMSSDVNINCI